MKYFRYIALIVTISFFYNIESKAQEDIIFNALKDELDRNMKELGKEEGYVPPCFIEFGLSDYKYNFISASLGSVSSIRDSKQRDKGVRVMVGDYYLSDENFNDNTTNSNHNDGNIILPLENDYMSIRRSYWITANNVYKNASELYRNKLSAMKLKGLTKEDLPAPDLSEEEPVIYIKDSYTGDFNEKKAIEKITKLSLLFKEYPKIHFSQVSLFYLISDEYVVNSEGSRIKQPFKMYFLHVGAVMPDEDLHQIWQQLIYYEKDLKELFDGKSIEEDIKMMAENLYAESTAEKFSEKYIGPIMLEDFAVLEEGLMSLFGSGNESLLAGRAPVVNNSQDGLVIPNIQTWENRIGKRVVDKKISISDISTSETYNGEKLMGHYELDMQGVKPSDSLVLIEDGILKSQMVSRTPTSKQHKSTGHLRLGLTQRGTNKVLSPGVVLISSNETIPKIEVKEKLIEAGKEEGLEYVLYAKTMETSANINPINYYKIDIETGEESLLRGVRFVPDVNDLRDIEYISENKKVYNTLFYLGGPGYTRGVPTSFISPDAIVIKETQISGNINTIKGELPLVPSPLYIESLGK